MEDLALFAFSNFEDHRIQPVTHPTDSAILLWHLGPPIEPVWSGEELLRFLKPNAALRISSEALALSTNP
jgi:hypothetical protein